MIDLDVFPVFFLSARQYKLLKFRAPKHEVTCLVDLV